MMFFVTDGLVELTTGSKRQNQPTVWAVLALDCPFLVILFKRRILMKKVGIVMGSDSDIKIAEKACDVLKKLEIPFEVHVYSAHRTPVQSAEFSKKAEENGFGAIIAMAGMAAHLAGAIAANTVVPVIGVPVKSSLDGLDALLATVQMPKGIPVATVAIDGGANAAYLAAQIIATSDKELYNKLLKEREKNMKDILEKDKKISDSFGN